MRKNNTAIIFGSLFFSCSVMAANGTLAPTVVPMVNGGQASIAISNTSPNLFTVPGEGADANASVTGNESTVPMQLRITGLVEMPNSKTYDATGCFVGLEAWGMCPVSVPLYVPEKTSAGPVF